MPWYSVESCLAVGCVRNPQSLEGTPIREWCRRWCRSLNGAVDGAVDCHQSSHDGAASAEHRACSCRPGKGGDREHADGAWVRVVAGDLGRQTRLLQPRNGRHTYIILSLSSLCWLSHTRDPLSFFHRLDSRLGLAVSKAVTKTVSSKGVTKTQLNPTELN